MQINWWIRHLDLSTYVSLSELRENYERIRARMFIWTIVGRVGNWKGKEIKREISKK